MNILLPTGILVLISSLARMIHLMFFERYFKLTFEDAPVWSFFYFAFWSGVVAFFFPGEIAQLFSEVTFIGYLVLFILLFIVSPGVYKLIRFRMGEPVWLSEIYPDEGMLSLEESYIFAKVGDVIFQQLIAGAMVLTLANGGIPYPQITIIFIVLFMIAHLYIFRSSGLFWGMHFTAYATLAGFAFPFLIIFIPGGIGYAIVLHMLFYVLSAAFFAVLPSPSRAVKRHLA